MALAPGDPVPSLLSTVLLLWPQVTHLFKWGWRCFLLCQRVVYLLTRSLRKGSIGILITVCGNHRFVLAPGISRRKVRKLSPFRSSQINSEPVWMTLWPWYTLQVVISEASFLCFDLELDKALTNMSKSRSNCEFWMK